MTWIRKKRKYSRPRKAFDMKRIEQENEMLKIYGLKSKREIWKADSEIGRIRNQAKELIGEDSEKQERLLEKLKKMGFQVNTIADVLALNKENWLRRRLQSILIMKKGVKPKQARQLIAHKHVAVDGKKVNIPSFIVSVENENKIQIIQKTKEMQEGKAE